MSKRSNWCEFSEKERKVIYERDKERCIMPNCYNSFGLGVAHIFLPRSKGGVGNRLNGALLCQHHHDALDSYGASMYYQVVKDYCEQYLINRYGDIDIEKLKYNKWRNFNV